MSIYIPYYSGGCDTFFDEEDFPFGIVISAKRYNNEDANINLVKRLDN